MRTPLQDYRVFLVAAVWMALAGAAYANQHALLEHYQALAKIELGVGIWLIETVVCALLVYWIAQPWQTSLRLWWTMETILPAQFIIGLAILVSSRLHVHGHEIVLSSLLSTAALMCFWRGEPGKTRLFVSAILMLLSCITVFGTWTAIICVAAGCLLCIGISYWIQPL